MSTTLDDVGHDNVTVWRGPADDWWRALCACGIHLGARRDLDAIVARYREHRDHVGRQALDQP
jgi:hypothetical protein